MRLKPKNILNHLRLYKTPNNTWFVAGNKLRIISGMTWREAYPICKVVMEQETLVIKIRKLNVLLTSKSLPSHDDEVGTFQALMNYGVSIGNPAMIVKAVSV